jgi:hypothetical protein
MALINKNIEIDADELISTAIDFISSIAINELCNYLKIFEKKRFEYLLGKMAEIELDYLENSDPIKLKNSLSEYMKEWAKLNSELSAPATNNQKAQIKIFQSKHRINNYDYRDILIDATGKQSVSIMNQYEIKLTMAKLSDYVNLNKKRL